jgi:integrase
VVGDRFAALYVLALTTGMRQGELLGLRWQDIDLEKRILRVRVNVQESNGRFILAETKTEYSRRSIALTQIAMRALQAHQQRQEEEKTRFGDAWNARYDLVFPNVVGGIMIPDNLAKWSFKQHLRQVGLPTTIRFHGLRHTAATLLLSSGVHPKVVSEMLGHTDISITLRVYAHVTPHMQHAAVEVMGGLFGRENA